MIILRRACAALTVIQLTGADIDGEPGQPVAQAVTVADELREARLARAYNAVFIYSSLGRCYNSLGQYATVKAIKLH